MPPRKAPSSRDDLVLDVLPYLARIKAARKEDTKTINRIVRMHNTAVPLTGEEPDEEQPGDEVIVSAMRVKNAALSGGSSRSSAPKPDGSRNFGQKVATLSRNSQSKGEESVGSAGSQLEGLWLEDDDIVDD
jgi:hypothetical protein